MALPGVNTKLAKKKLDPLDDLVDARMSVKPATSTTAVNEVAKPIADAARQGKTVSSGGSVPMRPSNGKGPAADPMDDLVDARSATEAEIDASNAKQQMDARSRAGLGGLGLSGGAQAGAADLARQQARTKALTMADFDKMMADQKFTDIQREAVTDDVEMAADFDYNDDGMIGGEKVGGSIGDRNPENDVTSSDRNPVGLDAQKQALAAQNEIYDVDDYSWWDDKDAQPGSVQVPYKYRGGKESLEAMLREVAPDALPLTKQVYDTGNPTDPKRTVYVDKFGNAYVLDTTQSTRRG